MACSYGTLSNSTVHHDPSRFTQLIRAGLSTKSVDIQPYTNYPIGIGKSHRGRSKYNEDDEWEDMGCLGDSPGGLSLRDYVGPEAMLVDKFDCIEYRQVQLLPYRYNRNNQTKLKH